MSEKEPRRWLRFEFTDGTSKQAEIVKCTVLNKKIEKVAFHLDKIEDNGYLMVVNDEFLPDGKKLDIIRVIREEGDQNEQSKANQAK